MASKQGAGKRRAIATATSLFGHTLIIAFLANELDKTDPAPTPAEAVTVTLEPWRPPVTPARPAASTAPAASRAMPARPSAIRPALVASQGAPTQGNGSAPPAPPAASTEPSPPSQGPLRTGCIGKRTNGREEEIDCTLEKWRMASGRPPREAPGDTIPDDKRAAYAAVARRQARQRAPVSQLGNATTMGCPFGNLGAACLDEMLIPLIGKKADK